MGPLGSAPPCPHPKRRQSRVRAEQSGRETIAANMTIDSKRAQDIHETLMNRLAPTMSTGGSTESAVGNRTELVTHVAACSTTMGLLLRDNENLRASVPPLVAVEFVPMGTQLAPRKKILALDVGGRLQEGVINHRRAGSQGACASNLVYEHPEYVLGHLSSTPMGQARFIVHTSPDFDAICAFFLARRLLLYGSIPERWKELVAYARAVDTAQLKVDAETIPVPLCHSLYAQPSPEGDKAILARGLALMQHLADWLDQDPGRTLYDADLFNGWHPFAEEQAFIGRDYDDYLVDVGRMQKRRLTLPRLYAAGEASVDVAVIAEPGSQMFQGMGANGPKRLPSQSRDSSPPWSTSEPAPATTTAPSLP